MRNVLWFVPFLAFSGCDTEIDNEPADKPMVNQQYEEKIVQLENQVDWLERSDGNQTNGYKLSQSTVQDARSYLKDLSQNINSTRAQHLPEWEQMFDALTLEAAVDTEVPMTLGFGEQKRVNNFYRQQLKITANTQQLAEHAGALAKDRTDIDKNAASIEIHEQRLGTMTRTLQDLAEQINAKFTQIDNIVAKYDERIADMETRVLATETDWNLVKSALQPKMQQFEARLTSIERQLSQYNIAAMYQRLGRLETTVGEHGTRITDVENRMTLTENNVTTLNTKQLATDQVVQKNKDEFDSLKADFDGKVPALETKVTAAEGKITALTAKATATDQAVQANADAIVAANAEITGIKQLLQSLNVADLQLKIQALEALLQAKADATELDGIRQELAALDADLTATVGKIVSTDENLSLAVDDLQTVKAELGALDKKVQEFIGTP